MGGSDIPRVQWFGTIGMLVGGWAVWEMYFLRSLWEVEFTSAKPLGEKIVKHMELREDVLRLLLLAAVVLALGTIAGAALRNAVNSDQYSGCFAEEYIIIYGAVC